MNEYTMTLLCEVGYHPSTRKSITVKRAVVLLYGHCQLVFFLKKLSHILPWPYDEYSVHFQLCTIRSTIDNSINVN